jgi:hypothetical protein
MYFKAQQEHLGQRIYMVGRCANNTPTEQESFERDHDLDDAPAAFRTHFIRSVMAMFTAN